MIEGLIARARTRGPERKYLDWLKTRPSALSGGYSWNEGTPFCEPAHWRTAKYSGTGCKPHFLAIPLTHAEHQLQHAKGQSAIGDREWWRQQCVEHLMAYLGRAAGEPDREQELHGTPP